MSSVRPFVVKDLVLTVLQAASEGAIGAVSPQVLVRVGAYMGITENAIRVTLSRLIKRKKIEKNGQGDYRMASDYAQFSHYLTQWRLGEPSGGVGWHLAHLCVTQADTCPSYA